MDHTHPRGLLLRLYAHRDSKARRSIVLGSFLFDFEGFLGLVGFGSVPLTSGLGVGRARWQPCSSNWSEALLGVQHCLKFVISWALMLLHDTFLRDSLVTGQWLKLRQAVVDKVMWWRSVIYCLAGHLSGLAITSKPKPPIPLPFSHFSVDRFLLEWFGSPCDVGSIEFEEYLSQLGHTGSAPLVKRFLDIHSTDPSRAQALLSSLLSPKSAPDIGLLDEASGARLTEAAIVDLLTREVAERPEQAHQGIDAFTDAVTSALGDHYKLAMREVADEPHMWFNFDEVQGWIATLDLSKASMRFPRAAVRNDNLLGQQLSWLLLNLFLALGVTPRAWLREITFIRKRGPQTVTDLKNLRPISYTDELQSLFDLAWLCRCRDKLERYIGSEQAGGRFDSCLVSVGILVALQVRRNWSLPTFCLKADLLQGYDLTWKSAVLLHARWAGISGSFWLCLHSALHQDEFRVKYGPLVGPALLSISAGLGQGGRRAVHLFNALARGIPDELRKRVIGVSVGASPMLLDALKLHQRLAGNVVLHDLVRLSSSLHAKQIIGQECNVDLEAVSLDTALLTIDVLASHQLLVSQFVDDVFVFQSTLWGVGRACNALETFCAQWRHRFASGKNKISLLVVSPYQCAHLQPPSLDGAEISIESSCHVLGPLFDRNFSLLPMLESLCGRIVKETAQLSASLRDLAIGLPHQVLQMSLRVESKVLFGCEVLASASPGWLQVAKLLNAAHYKALKALLGIEGASLGQGGYSRILWILGLDLRLSSKVALRIFSLRARLFSLPSHNPVFEAVTGASKVTGATWLDDAKALLSLYHIGPESDFNSFARRLPTSMPSKVKVRCWVRSVVVPALVQFDRSWRETQLDPSWLANASLEHSVRLILSEANWTKRVWQYARCWYLSRLSGAPAFAAFGRALPANPHCSHCHCGLSLRHLIHECPLASSTNVDWSAWLQPCREASVLRDRIMHVGRCTARAMYG